MKPGHSTTRARALRIYCPVAASTWANLATADGGGIESDPTLSAILDVIRDDNPLGDFGIYEAVVELNAGWETFRPGPGARPTVGEAGRNALSPTAILTVYLPGDACEERLAEAIDRILEVHPWEVPVIEIVETRLVRRAT